MGTDWSAHKKNRNLAIAGKRADSKNEPIFFALRGIGALSYPLIFSEAKMQPEVGVSMRRVSYDES
jgi:hypothetical protein